jgi:hypothetical protein
MLGKHSTLGDVNIDRVDEVMGAGAFAEVIRAAGLVAMVNWTMLPRCESIWLRVAELLSAEPADRPRPHVMVDLADPNKRDREDLRRALDMVSRLQGAARVTMAMNLSEGYQVGELLGIERGPADDQSALTRQIREALGVETVVVHPRHNATATRQTASGLETAVFDGPFVAKPKISTGAGDHFNAGFMLAQRLGLPLDQCLCAGTGTSGYYVRHAESPTRDALADFCADLPLPDPR